MDAELKAKLLEYLGTLEEVAKKGADFSAEQVPLAIQEYIAFTIAWDSVVIGLCLIPIVAGLIAYRKLWVVLGVSEGNGFDDGDALFFRSVAACVTCLALLIPTGVAVESAREVALATLAPRVFLIEKVAELVK